MTFFGFLSTAPLRNVTFIFLDTSDMLRNFHNHRRNRQHPVSGATAVGVERHQATRTERTRNTRVLEAIIRAVGLLATDIDL